MIIKHDKLNLVAFNKDISSVILQHIKLPSLKILFTWLANYPSKEVSQTPLPTSNPFSDFLDSTAYFLVILTIFKKKKRHTIFLLPSYKLNHNVENYFPPCCPCRFYQTCYGHCCQTGSCYHAHEDELYQSLLYRERFEQIWCWNQNCRCLEVFWQGMLFF